VQSAKSVSKRANTPARCIAGCLITLARCGRLHMHGRVTLTATRRRNACHCVAAPIPIMLVTSAATSMRASVSGSSVITDLMSYQPSCGALVISGHLLPPGVWLCIQGYNRIASTSRRPVAATLTPIGTPQAR